MMQSLSLFRPGASRLAVIDTETTGFSRHDRIVEFACVTVVNGQIVEEYETLLQPNRDPGPVHIHGITSSMLDAAPEFGSVAADIASRLDGAMIVAHNISFDLRMLNQEISRVPAMSFDPGSGICTYRLTRQKLSIAAQQAGISEPDHNALCDARVTAQVLLRLPERSWGPAEPATCRSPGTSTAFTVRRPGAPPRQGALSMLALRTAWPSTATEAEVLYLDTLDRCLDDGELSREEQVWLDSTAAALGLSNEHRTDLHARYQERLIEQIMADGIVTEQERLLHDSVAAALSLKGQSLPPDDPSTSGKTVRLTPGMTVCFTGTGVYGGVKIERSELERLAEEAGLRTVKSVTRRCDLLVAGDVNSRSGKAGKARRYGIPVIDLSHYLGLVSEAEG